MAYLLYVILALLMLGILICVHEAGHFAAARLCGISVRAFSIGFGPKLWGKTGKNGTEYTLRAIPCGGYCAFYADRDLEHPEKEEPRALNRQPAWKRFITLAAGPFMNFLLAFLVALCFYAVSGIPYSSGAVECEVAEVTAESPAYMAGFKAGDIITAVNGIALDESGELLRGYDGNGTVPMTVKRGKETLTLEVKPDYISTEGRYMIGVTVQYGYGIDWRHEGLFKAIGGAWNSCVSLTGQLIETVRLMFTGGVSTDDLSGPVGTVAVIAEQTRQYKLTGYLNLLIVISINLGVLNLLPLPALDGGRLLFVLYELIFRRPVNRNVEAAVHALGFLLLMVLAVVLVFKDITNLF